jgi:hypothetical protein
MHSDSRHKHKSKWGRKNDNQKNSLSQKMTQCGKLQLSIMPTAAQLLSDQRASLQMYTWPYIPPFTANIS